MDHPLACACDLKQRLETLAALDDISSSGKAANKFETRMPRHVGIYVRQERIQHANLNSTILGPQTSQPLSESLVPFLILSLFMNLKPFAEDPCSAAALPYPSY